MGAGLEAVGAMVFCSEAEASELSDALLARAGGVRSGTRLLFNGVQFVPVRGLEDNESTAPRSDWEVCGGG